MDGLLKNRRSSCSESSPTAYLVPEVDPNLIKSYSDAELLPSSKRPLLPVYANAAAAPLGDGLAKSRFVVSLVSEEPLARTAHSAQVQVPEKTQSNAPTSAHHKSAVAASATTKVTTPTSPTSSITPDKSSQKIQTILLRYENDLCG